MNFTTRDGTVIFFKDWGPRDARPIMCQSALERGSDSMLVQSDGTMSGISRRIAVMSRGLSLAPCGLVIERVESETDKLLLVARPISKTAACPTCSSISACIHSQYQRALADLPSQGRLVRIRLWTRRFRCAVAECHQKIFTERLEATASRPFARRTTRLEGIVHHVGLALGGRPGQSIARRLLLPVSKDTLSGRRRRARLLSR